MRIVHSLNHEKIEKEVQDEVGFLLTNKSGAYLSLFNQPTSRYQGWFVPFRNNLYKIIENIEPTGFPSVGQLENVFWSVNRKRGSLNENFFLPPKCNSLIYEISEPGEIELTLDIKESYQDPEFGRFYEISAEKDVIVIKYRYENEAEFYLAIKSETLDYQEIGEWISRNYQLDQKRNSPPFERYVYRALRITGQKIVFSIAEEKKEAVKEARFVFKKGTVLKKAAMEKNEKLSHLTDIKDTELKMAYISACNSLDDLTFSNQNGLGIYAGLPWFFDFWARDEAVSLRGLGIFSGEKAKNILFGLLAEIEEDGRISTRPTGNVDAVGWLFKRAGDFISEKKFNKKEIKIIKEILEKSIEGLLKHHTQNSLAINASSETWMDSQDRNGARIEAQALRLKMYQMAYQLTKEKKYFELERKLREITRDKFWNGQFLADGSDDFTIRPNIFLAAYIYPDFLEKDEWTRCFENILPKLWLDWGGFATIDKDSPLFRDSHTGQEPTSYHNGDSWFYLNNLIALVLYQFGGRKFICQIDKVLEASAKEILWKGLIGCHAELSSAKEFNSEGCWTQAWSSALFLELINGLKNND